MVPDPGRTCVGMEYFCFEGDELWNAGDDELVARATRELEAIGLAPAPRVVAGHVVRVAKAYPIYDADYEARVATIRDWLAQDRQPAADRPQRAAPLQQLRSLDADRAARRRERDRRDRARPVGGQRRRRVPRGGAADGLSPTATRPRRRRCGRAADALAVSGQSTE